MSQRKILTTIPVEVIDKKIWQSKIKSFLGENGIVFKKNQEENIFKSIEDLDLEKFYFYIEKMLKQRMLDNDQIPISTFSKWLEYNPVIKFINVKLHSFALLEEKALLEEAYKDGCINAHCLMLYHHYSGIKNLNDFIIARKEILNQLELTINPKGVNLDKKANLSWDWLTALIDNYPRVVDLYYFMPNIFNYPQKTINKLLNANNLSALVQLSKTKIDISDIPHNVIEFLIHDVGIKLVKHFDVEKILKVFSKCTYFNFELLGCSINGIKKINFENFTFLYFNQHEKYLQLGINYLLKNINVCEQEIFNKVVEKFKINKLENIELLGMLPNLIKITEDEQCLPSLLDGIKYFILNFSAPYNGYSEISDERFAPLIKVLSMLLNINHKFIMIYKDFDIEESIMRSLFSILEKNSELFNMILLKPFDSLAAAAYSVITIKRLNNYLTAIPSKKINEKNKDTLTNFLAYLNTINHTITNLRDYNVTIEKLFDLFNTNINTADQNRLIEFINKLQRNTNNTDIGELIAYYINPAPQPNHQQFFQL